MKWAIGTGQEPNEVLSQRIPELCTCLAKVAARKRHQRSPILEPNLGQIKTYKEYEMQLGSRSQSFEVDSNIKMPWGVTEPRLSNLVAVGEIVKRA